MNQIIRRWAARRDLVDIVYHYISAGSPDSGRRFRLQAEATFRRLARMPGIGIHYEHGSPALARLRFFPVSRFKNYLVFYRPITNGIEVLRVLHGARDIHSILLEEFGIEEDASDGQADDEKT
jgi:toxin ParE1/3/4